jgi:translation initiation factor IF-3
MIRVFEVRVVDEDGSQLGVMRTADAMRLAQERGLDLVEVAPLASPPVARLLDFGQYKYELTKREKEAKRKQRSVTFKEVRIKPKIGIGDFDTKVRRAIEFLEDGDRVKISVTFRGRELTHPQIGRDLLDKFAEQIKEHGVVERPPLLEGKSMHISVASTHKPKVHEPTPSATAKANTRPSDEGDDVIATAQDMTNEAPPAPPAPPRPEPESGSASTGV